MKTAIGQITWNTDVNAPCCLGEIVADDGRTLLIQTDWDYPGIAGSLGWRIADTVGDDENNDCEHRSTDGTIDCPDCGVTASEFIESARDWLDDNDGATAEDPGYFS